MDKYIGFLIMFFVLLLPVLRKILEERDRRRNPQKYEKERREKERQEELLRKALMEEYKDEARRKKRRASPPQPQVRHEELSTSASHERILKDYTMRSQIEGRRDVASIDKREFHGQLDTFEQKSKVGEMVSEEWGNPDKKRKSMETSYVCELLKQPDGKKSMIIMNEIMRGPMAGRRLWR